MSKYNTDLDYAMPLIDISPEELKEIAAEADVIIADNSRSPRELAEAYLKKGQCLQMLEEYRNSLHPLLCFDNEAKQDEIKALIEKALELSADMPEALMQMGKSVAEIEKSIELYTRAILLKRDYAAAYNNRGKVWRIRFTTQEEIYDGNNKRAVADFSEAIRIRPNNADYYYNRGGCYAELGEHEKAIADFTSTIRYGSQAFIQQRAPFCKRGTEYKVVKDYGKAVADFSESLRLSPDERWAASSLWNIYQEAGDSDQTVAGMIRNTKERIIRGLNLKSLEISKKDPFLEGKVYTHVIFDNGIRGRFEVLPVEIDESIIVHVRNILDSLNTLDTSSRKTFRKKWEITSNGTAWDKFYSYVNPNDVFLSDIIFNKDHTFQLKYSVPEGGEKISGYKTDEYFITSRFRKDLKTDFIYFERDPLPVHFHEKKYPLSLNGLGGKETYIAGIAEDIHRFIIDQEEVEEDALTAHFSQLSKIEILIALERLKYDKKIKREPSVSLSINDVSPKYSGEYVYYYPLTAKEMVKEKEEEENRPRKERLERILLAHNLHYPDINLNSEDIATGIAFRQEPEGRTCFEFELRGDELTKLEKEENEMGAIINFNFSKDKDLWTLP